MRELSAFIVGCKEIVGEFVIGAGESEEVHGGNVITALMEGTGKLDYAVLAEIKEDNSVAFFNALEISDAARRNELIAHRRTVRPRLAIGILDRLLDSRCLRGAMMGKRPAERLSQVPVSGAVKQVTAGDRAKLHIRKFFPYAANELHDTSLRRVSPFGKHVHEYAGKTLPLRRFQECKKVFLMRVHA